MPFVDLLRRLLGLTSPDESGVDAGGEPGEAAPEPATTTTAGELDNRPAPTPVACPSCATLISPPPSRDRLCPRCRRRIIVRHVEGRLVLLSDAALPVFEAEHQREALERAWTSARRRWLALAAGVGAPAARRGRLAAAPLTAAVVDASRTLYLRAAEVAVRKARLEKRWDDVAWIRRQQAAELYAEAGSPVPPPDDLAALHREGLNAVLRSLSAVAKGAELVGAACCHACAADEGKAFRIAAELQQSRLPHAGCPKGLCACDWWTADADRTGRRRRRVAGRPARMTPPRPAATPDGGPSSMASPAGPPTDDAPIQP